MWGGEIRSNLESKLSSRCRIQNVIKILFHTLTAALLSEDSEQPASYYPYLKATLDPHPERFLGTPIYLGGLQVVLQGGHVTPTDENHPPSIDREL